MIRLRDVRWLELIIVLLTLLTIGALSACNSAHIATDPATSTEPTPKGSIGSFTDWLGLGVDKASNNNELAQYPPFSSLKKSEPPKGEILLIAPIGEQKILNVDNSGRVLIWDSATSPAGELVGSRLLYDRHVAITAAASLSDQALIATAAVDGIELSRGGVPWKKLTKLKAQVWSLAFEPNGNSLLIGGSDGLVYRWNYTLQPTSSNEEEKMLERYVGHGASVTSVAYHPQGRLFFSGDWRGALSAWLEYGSDAYGGQYDENLFGRRFFGQGVTRRNASRIVSESIERIAVSPDGRMVALGCSNGGIELISVRAFKSGAWAPTAHKGMVVGLAFSADGTELFSVGRDETLKRWTISRSEDEVAYQLTPTAQATVSLPRVLAINEDGRVFIGTAEGKIVEPKWNKL